MNTNTQYPSRFRPAAPEQDADPAFPVLVAEDEAVSRRFLEKMLSKEGFEVTAVENGREALDCMKDRFYPLVITDWNMPEMDGLELCRAIREYPFPGYVFIVMVTHRDALGDLIRGMEAGADDYVCKPFNRIELVARLRAGKRVLHLERTLKEANQRLEESLAVDPLTGSYNRGYLMERLPGELARARRYARPLSLVMSDIDHFKSVNDRMGHQAGDEVLRQFVNRLSRGIRRELDWVARYGGEEFLIVLPETNAEDADHAAERLRAMVSKCAFLVEGTPVPVTASFGVSGVENGSRADRLSPENLIRDADECLYQAKQQGRNRVATRRNA